MTVLFRKSEGGQRFLNVWNDAKSRNQGFALFDMDKKVCGSKVLGYTLADTSATDFQLRFDREFFAENYDQIINSHETLATYETLIFLIKAALGAETVVTFESPNPAHLIVNIQEPSNLARMKTIGGDTVMAKDGAGALNYLMLKATTSQYTLNQVEMMLKSIEAAGVFVEYNFIKGAQ